MSALWRGFLILSAMLFALHAVLDIARDHLGLDTQSALYEFGAMILAPVDVVIGWTRAAIDDAWAWISSWFAPSDPQAAESSVDTSAIGEQSPASIFENVVWFLLILAAIFPTEIINWVGRRIGKSSRNDDPFKNLRP